jgi:glycosyltransferase 2 family protein
MGECLRSSQSQSYTVPNPESGASNASLRKRLAKLVPWVFYALVAIFAYFYLRGINWGALAKVQINWWWIAASTVASIAVRYWFAGIWMFLLTSLGANLTGQRTELFLVYAKSWLGRYIPGGATWILGKIYFAGKLGISKAKLGISSFLEGALQIIVVLISAAGMLAFDPHVQKLAHSWVWLLLAAAMAGLVTIYPPVFNRVIQFGYSKVRKQPLAAEHLPGTKTIGQGILAFLVSSILSGLSFYFVAAAVDPSLGWDSVLFIIGASNLASALSMLAVFAPAGLGVREGIQLAMLLLVMSPEQALVATVLMRVWSIVTDALFAALAWGFRALR